MAVKIYAVHDKSGYAGSGTGASGYDSVHDTAQAKNAFFAQEDGTQGVRVQGNASTVNIFRAFFEFNVPEDAPSTIQSLALLMTDTQQQYTYASTAVRLPDRRRRRVGCAIDAKFMAKFKFTGTCSSTY